MSDALKNVSTKKTSQREKMLGKDQVENSEGGFVFQVDKWERLNRFLILGSDGGTYYINQKDLTKQNVGVLNECLQEDGLRLVQTVVDISTAGRAPKNDQAIFALAFSLTHGNLDTRRKAAEVLPLVCRTGTHLFQFARYIENLGGWGPVKRRAVANWYQEKSPEHLAYQLVKYRQREGFTHHDLLHLSHPKPVDEEHDKLYHFVKELSHDTTPMVYIEDKQGEIIEGYRAAQLAKTPKESARLIAEYNLPRECIQTEHLNDPAVWEALLPSMPITALIRNLGNMSKIGLLTPLSETSKFVTEKLTNEEVLKKGRVHPIAVLLALTTYASGRGVRGTGTWSPVSQVVDALDDAFYKSFGNVEPIGNNVCLALDVSSSMGSALAGTHLSASQGSCAMAMVTARTEKNWMVCAFTSQGSYRRSVELSIVSISPRQRLDDLVRETQAMTFGGTDCSLPMLMATQENWPIDTFLIYTDSETWAGRIHPTQALEAYRQHSGREAKLVVVGMTSNGFTIADPSDAGMLDVVGFDSSAPNVIAEFARHD